MDIKKVREDFDIFKNNPKLIYLDNAATSLKPNSVVEAMNKYYKEYPYSINRGSYSMAQKPTQLYNESRKLVADFINADEDEIIFTKSTTSSLNHLANIIGKGLEKGDEIIVSNMEHHSNFIPWQVLSQEKGLKLVIVEAKNLKIDVLDIKKSITPKTKVIAIHHISNVIGDEVDVKEVCNIAREKKIITVIDGAQAAPHMKIDIKDMGCDFYTISGHKMLGPTGIGILYILRNRASKINPFEYGGDMVVPSTVDKNYFESKDTPHKFEAGTPSIAEVIGLGEAIKYLNKIGMDNIHNYEVELKEYALELLKGIEDEIVIYNKDVKNGIFLFNIKNVAVHDAVSESILSSQTFDHYGIALRDGQHCNNLTMKYVIGEKSTLRASFYFYNTKEEVEKFVEVIKKIYKQWN